MSLTGLLARVTLFFTCFSPLVSLVLVPKAFGQANSFLIAVTYDSGAPCIGGIQVADLNRDGNPDVVLAGGCPDINMMGIPGTISILLGNGNGTFKPAVVYGSGGINTQSLQIADVNNDAKLDVVAASPCATVACSSSAIGVLLGNGDGTLKPVTVIPAQNVGIVKTADLNRDGKVDLVTDACVTPGCVLGAIAIRLGNGNGTFQNPISYRSGALHVTDLQVADLNQDGLPDVLALNQCSTQECTPSQVGVLLGNGNGTLQPAVVYDAGGRSAVSLDLADFNKDGNLDLVIANESCVGSCLASSIAVLLGNGDGSFQTARTTLLPAPAAHAVRAVDLNADHADDIVVTHCTLGTSTGFSCPGTSGSVDILFGNGDGTFQSPGVRSSGGINAVGLAVADVNRDNHPDILIGNQKGESTGNGTLGILLHSNSSLKSASVVVSTNMSPAFIGQTLTFEAKVTSPAGPIPDGELVTFFDSYLAIGTALTANGSATFNISSLTAKTHTIKAVYSGDALFKPASGSVKQTITLYPTSTALSSSANPSLIGQGVTFSAKVTSSGPLPTGKVRFMNGATGIGTAPLVDGVAVLLSSKLVAGTHAITATYLGDGTHAKSSSPILNEIVH